MVQYLIKYYLAISFGCVFPIIIILNLIPFQSNQSLVMSSIRWAGFAGVYLTYLLFKNKNYWILYYNLRYRGIYILFLIAGIYELSSVIIDVWIL